MNRMMNLELDDNPQTPIKGTTPLSKKGQTTYVWTFNIKSEDGPEAKLRPESDTFQNDSLATPIHASRRHNDDQMSLRSKTPNSILDKMHDFSPYRRTTDQKRFDNSPFSPSLWKKINSSFKKTKHLTSTPLSNIFQNTHEKEPISDTKSELPEIFTPLMEPMALFRNEFLQFSEIDASYNEPNLYDKYNSELILRQAKSKVQLESLNQQTQRLEAHELKRRPNLISTAPAPRPVIESSEKERGATEGCNCRSTHCLKLYCECLRKGLFCNGCNCSGCENHPESDYRHEKVKHIEKKNPQAFKPIISSDKNDEQARVHTKGCNCRRSNCLKNYCECHQFGVKCSEFCKCLDCKNCSEDTEQIKTAFKKADIRQLETTKRNSNFF